MKDIDKEDCIILNLLQKNCRVSLTDIAKEIGLSIDSVKKRIKKMENIYFYPRVQIRPRNFGFNNIVDVKIKLNTHSKEKIDEFINYLEGNPRVTEIFGMSGEWNLSLVIISKDIDDLNEVTLDIKNKFGDIISSWSESTTLKVYKFETYDMIKLLNIEEK